MRLSVPAFLPLGSAYALVWGSFLRTLISFKAWVSFLSFRTSVASHLLGSPEQKDVLPAPVLLLNVPTHLPARLPLSSQSHGASVILLVYTGALELPCPACLLTTFECP